jgi:hypothetical protein
MNRSTAVALTGCLIVLVAYIAVTSASLVRELNSSSMPAATPAESAGAPLQASESATNDNRVELREAQARSPRRHKFRAVSHHGKTRIKQEPVTLFL